MSKKSTVEGWLILRNQVMIMKALRLIIRNQIGDLEMTRYIEEQIKHTTTHLEPE